MNGFPDEVYFFHPIKFIDHLNKLQKDLAIKTINILVVDVRSGKPVVNALVKKIKVGDIVTEFKYDSKAISGISGKASQEALLGLGENPGSPSENYGTNGKAAYKSYWEKRGYSFELGKDEKKPEEEKMQAIINEYNHHRATDSNGVLKVSIFKPLLDKKKLNIEVSFHDFPIVVEKLRRDSRNKPILRNNTDETATGFSIEWTGNQILDEGGNFGWTIKYNSMSSEFKTSEKLVVKDDEEKFTQFKINHFSKHYNEDDYNYHFVLFAMLWCQPVWDYIVDPVNPVAGSISQQSYIQNQFETNCHMHIVTYVKELPGRDKYGGKGYGKCEGLSSGTRWRSSGHRGIDLYAR
ncbi:hypothetical protein KKA14_06780, partial [bacterium]|nr:hypothetical protein [bacterium]